VGNPSQVRVKFNNAEVACGVIRADIASRGGWGCNFAMLFTGGDESKRTWDLFVPGASGELEILKGAVVVEHHEWAIVVSRSRAMPYDGLVEMTFRLEGHHGFIGRSSLKQPPVHPHCAYCGAPYSEGQTQCQHCGAPVLGLGPDYAYCEYCSCPNPVGAVACQGCGARKEEVWQCV